MSSGSPTETRLCNLIPYIRYIFLPKEKMASRVVAMESLAPDDAQEVIKNCPVCAGKNTYTFHECETKLRVCLPFHRGPVFKAFQGKAQPPSSLGSADTVTLDVDVERTRRQPNQDTVEFYPSPSPAPKTTPLISSREGVQKMERGTDMRRGRF